MYSSKYFNLKYDSFNIKLDSIKVVVKFNQNKIIVDNYFTKSKRSLNIQYYFSDTALFYIITSETCPSKPYLTCNSGYYVKANKVSQEQHSSSRQFPNGHGTISVKEIALIHFCPSRFDYSFISKYIWILLETIKEKVAPN